MLSKRLVLENVPRVHFYEGGKLCPEDILLPSVMRAVLAFLGEPDYGCQHCLGKTPNCTILCTYSFLVGVSGAAAFFSWKEGWHGDNGALFYMSKDPSAPDRRIFDAVGYSYEVITKDDGRNNEAIFRQRICDSLERGVPVVAYGVIGPLEPCILAGYDEEGDVLLGWSFFQSFPEFNAGAEFDACGYFRKRDWFKDTASLCIIGEQKTKPSLREVGRDSLDWMHNVACTPMVRPEPDAPERYHNRHNGLAAYDAWIEHLLRDAEWRADNEAALRAHHEIHNSAIGTVAEARWYGSMFLGQIAQHFTAGSNQHGTTEHIFNAAACYAAEHDLMWKIWDLAGGISNPEAFRSMADPGRRQAMAGIIRQARDKDAQAAEHFKQALL
jgi:hypothetical protein